MVDGEVAPPKCRNNGSFRVVDAYDIYQSPVAGVTYNLSRLRKKISLQSTKNVIAVELQFINTGVEGGVTILYALKNCVMHHISYVAHTFAGESSYAGCNGGQYDDAQTIKAVRTGKRKLQHIAM
nr:hypothetical protein [Tanacetum cinerariifolium]